MRSLYISLAILFIVSANVLGQKPQTDRKFEGYKGLVKRVVTERADWKIKKGKSIESNRRLEQDIEYDRDGNVLKELSYDYVSGLLREVAVYKKIDGEKTVCYPEGEMPGGISNTIIVKDVDHIPRDPQYSFKFEYKYNSDGKIVEEAWWENTGELWLRYVYTYEGDKRTELVYDANGELNQKYISIFDKNDNLIEQSIYDTDTDSVIEKSAYKYLEFDTTGNWTKRSESAGDDESNFVEKPREITYRKINYFSD